MKKRTQCLWLILSLVLSLCPVQTEVASAAATPKLSKKTVTFTKLGVTKKVKVKNIKASKVKSIKVVTKNESVVSAAVVSSTVFSVSSTGEGKTTVKVVLKLWKPLSKKKKKKSYAFKLTVVVDLPEVTHSAGPSSTPTVTPPPSATPTVTPPPSATPTVTPTPTASAKPTSSPTVSPSAKPTATTTVDPATLPTLTPPSNLSAEEQEVYDKIVAKRTEYPDGMHWDDNNFIKWYAFLYEPDYYVITARGCVGIACILSDAAFGECTWDSKDPRDAKLINPARQIDHPSPDSIRVGDIIRINGNSHSAIVIGTDGDQFTLAEGNVQSYLYDYEPVIMWGRKIPKSDPIDYVWTRWQP